MGREGRGAEPIKLSNFFRSLSASCESQIVAVDLHSVFISVGDVEGKIGSKTFRRLLP